MSRQFPTSWLPPDLGTDPLSLDEVLRRMAGRKERLTRLPVQRIVDALDATSKVWLKKGNDRRDHLVAAISADTGVSPQMVALSIRLEMESSQGPHLIAALKNEIGNSACLDSFTSNPLLAGETFAVGPGLVGGIVSSNIPALPHLTVMRSLLVKAPCVVKSSKDEPLFLPAYLQSLWDVDPEVGACAAAVSFGREDTAQLDTFLGGIDFLIAYGGLDAIAGLRQKWPDDSRALYHGHKLGFGIVAADALGTDLNSLAEKIAWDVVLFDQEACLAPHVIFVEGNSAETFRLAEEVATSMEKLAVELPPARRSLAAKLALRQELDSLAVLDQRAQVCPAGSPDSGVVVVQETDTFLPSPLGRFVRLVPVPSVETALKLVEPLEGLLQNASIACTDDSRRREIATALARAGVARVCPPGNMGTPTMMWHHDGFPCIAKMLRFCDWETSVGRLGPLG